MMKPQDAHPAVTELPNALAGLVKEFSLLLSKQQDEVVLDVQPKDLLAVVTRLKADQPLAFSMLIDVTAVDWLAAPAVVGPRFKVVYCLLSISHNYRLRLNVAVDETLAVPSLVALYPNANWYEREVWDMFGISFLDHPDQRRLLTDYNFQHHPLRKDFPLQGYEETFYDQQSGKVLYKKIDLPQEIRNFDKSSVWLGMNENVELGN